MVEVVTMIIPWRRLDSFSKVVDDQLDCCVSDGVEAHLPARFVSLLDECTKFFLIDVQGSVKAGLASVGIDRVCAGPGKASINKYFYSSNSEALISMSGFFSKGFHLL